MLAVFCLRLALGMLLALLLLSPRLMHPRFFRTHFVTALGLTVVAAAMAPDWNVTLYLLPCVLFTLLGSIVWIFEKPPAGWTFLGLSAAAIIANLVFWEVPEPAPLTPLTGRIVSDITSAALLGFSVTAMLVGHSYLISPGLTIRPLMGQIIGLFVALLARTAVAATALWFWTGDHDITNVNNETVLWLPVRWLIGLLGPLIFGFMSFQTARIRSTQSATGILYVVVILTFLGELTSLLLMRNTGLPL